MKEAGKNSFMCMKCISLIANEAYKHVIRIYICTYVVATYIYIVNMTYVSVSELSCPLLGVSAAPDSARDALAEAHRVISPCHVHGSPKIFRQAQYAQDQLKHRYNTYVYIIDKQVAYRVIVCSTVICRIKQIHMP